MSRKVKVATITSLEQFNMNKPRYNGYACGHGAHKNKKAYVRRQQAHQLYKMMREVREGKPL